MLNLEEYFNQQEKSDNVFNVSYYQLKEDKEMEDGQIISYCSYLRFLYAEGNYMMFETCNEDDNTQIIFWSSPQEVDFLFSKKEEYNEKDIDILEKKIFDKWIF